MGDDFWINGALRYKEYYNKNPGEMDVLADDFGDEAVLAVDYRCRDFTYVWYSPQYDSIAIQRCYPGAQEWWSVDYDFDQIMRGAFGNPREPYTVNLGKLWPDEVIPEASGILEEVN